MPRTEICRLINSGVNSVTEKRNEVQYFHKRAGQGGSTMIVSIVSRKTNGHSRFVPHDSYFVYDLCVLMRKVSLCVILV